MSQFLGDGNNAYERRHSSEEAGYDAMCEEFDEQLRDSLADCIENALEALGEVAQGIVSEREEWGLESYDNGEIETAVKQLIELLAGEDS